MMIIIFMYCECENDGTSINILVIISILATHMQDSQVMPLFHNASTVSNKLDVKRSCMLSIHLTQLNQFNLKVLTQFCFPSQACSLSLF